MASSDIRRQRQALMSAPPLSCLPRVDSRPVRKELTSPLRRQATDVLRRQYLQSRRHEFETRSRKLEELEHLRRNIKLRYCPQKTHEPKKYTNTLNETEWRREITKVNLPERLPISVSLRIKSAQPTSYLMEQYNTTNPMFYRTHATRRSGPNGKNKLQYFISQDWSSEKLSWINFHKNVSEFHKVSWVC